MANVNLGPAVTSTASQTAALASNFTPNFGMLGNGQNALRAICIGRAVSLNGTGDALFMPLINVGSFVATNIVFTNGLISGVSGNIAAASVGIFTNAAGAGTVIRTAGVLTGMTSTAVALVNAAASAGALVTNFTGLYFNVGTAVANATVDCFVYGYDVT